MGLRDAIAGWVPASIEKSEVIDPWPTTAFSAMLELPAPAAREDEPLPLLWHWFHLLDTPRGSELGDDGHPAVGGFLPPIPDRRRMIAGGRVKLTSPILIGERVTRRAELVSATVKNGRSGELAFVTTRYEFRRGEELLLTEEQDVVYRSQPAGQHRRLTASADTVGGHDWAISTRATSPLLFRFSALTYNAHRIHYDQRYARDTEDYPDLVVHGPLLALLMLEIPRRHAERPVSAFEYRLTRPAFRGATIQTGGSSADGERFTLSTTVDGAVSASGSAAVAGY